MFGGIAGGLSYFAVSTLPWLCVVLFGAYICVRHRRHKRRQAAIAGLALGLMVLARGVPMLLFPLMQALGIDFTAGLMNAMMLSAVLSFPDTAALALLLWAIFGDFEPYEEPVFRFDDEREHDEA